MALHLQANKPVMLFACSGIDPAAFSVYECTGIDPLAGMYRFSITLKKESTDIEPRQLVGQTATLFLYRLELWHPYSGIITEASFGEVGTDYCLYHVVLSPQLWKLTLTTQCRIFQEKSVVDVITDVLKESKLQDYFECDVDRNAYSTLEYVAQYNETDFNFLSRIMQANGIWYFFKEPVRAEEGFTGSAEGETMVITDSPQNFPFIASPQTIKFRNPSQMVQKEKETELESVHELIESRTCTPALVIVKNYNYRTPEIDVIAQAPIEHGDEGEVHFYGGSSKNTSEAQRYAKVNAQRFASTRITVRGASTCSVLRSGSRFEIEDHPRQWLNQAYLITEVEHRATLQGKNRTSLSYSNRFKALPAETSALYRPAILAVTAVIPDLLTATIEGTGSEYATIDEQGRYKVRMPFDRSGAAPFQASQYIRMVQEYSGGNYGMHFPSHEKAEVIIAHVNGDPDKPIGLRTVPNADTISPVKNTNRQQAIIRTAAGNEIIMDDTAGLQKMSLRTPQVMKLTAQHDQAVAVENNYTVSVKRDEVKKIGIDQTMTITGKQDISITGDKNETIAGKSMIEVTSDTDESVSGKKEVLIKGDNCEKYSAARSIRVKADSTETIEGNCSKSVKAAASLNATGSIAIQADKNIAVAAGPLLTLSANSITIKGSDDLGIKVGASSIVITAEGIGINSPVVTMLGGIIKQEAKTTNTMNATVVMLN
ncbi:MAG: type VI secretion system tip protein VgrG [Chitinivibrionales bacterium]|nr:type VI secretion system tip protein VgrG [Chitinivibrionales bacterium]